MKATEHDWARALKAQRAAHAKQLEALFEAVSPCERGTKEFGSTGEWVDTLCYFNTDIAPCTFATCPLDGVKELRKKVEDGQTNMR